MEAICLAALILGSGFAIASGQGAKWKVLNAVMILTCMGLEFGLGYAVGLGSGYMGLVRNQGVPFAMMFGVAGAMACVARNTSSSNVCSHRFNSREISWFVRPSATSCTRRPIESTRLIRSYALIGPSPYL
jgi:hypothetical protein